MASTFQTESAASAELLTCILEGNPWPDYLLRRALIEDEGRQLFSVVIERLEIFLLLTSNNQLAPFVPFQLLFV